MFYYTCDINFARRESLIHRDGQKKLHDQSLTRVPAISPRE